MNSVLIRRQSPRDGFSGRFKDVAEGKDPPQANRDPARNRFPQIFVRDEMIPASIDWRTCWKEEVEWAAALADGRLGTATRVVLSR